MSIRSPLRRGAAFAARQSSLAALAFASISGAYASETPNPEAQNRTTTLDTVVTTAHTVPHRRFDLLQSTSVLQGEELALRLEGTVGETLSSLPGITSTFFGPGASRPIIRGLDGDRIRVLVNGIGSIDASSTSVDHAVAGDTLTAQTIEVIRGPANLMYGSNAAGGVVNILDGRIPQRLPENGFSGEVTGLYGSAADEWAGGANVNAAVGNVVVHLSGFIRDTGNYDIPGFAILDDDDHEDDHDDEHEDDHENEDDHDHEEEEENTEGFVANSDSETKGVTAGLSYVWEDGFFGFAYSRYDTNYGIPPGAHGHEEGDEEEGEEEVEEIVRIDLVQDRFDLAG
ncbi:MAG: Plug domain-containing protein, partial [Proteobacteria bacterium]|nr:Plug domain-containing protein [Pseudomonadota bacterium]